ncbi:MAG TPA: hypothetical protein VHW66_22295 [Stellaceae bacterium]|jgi:hypothetical protein|nr:hypothetical protein [Stellaceae bacterium]
MLKLAKDGALDNDPERFQRYVYPQQIDTVLTSEVARLKLRIELLRADPTKRYPPLEALVIPPELALPPWPEPTRGGA